jgi:hypothetical protein
MQKVCLWLQMLFFLLFLLLVWKLDDCYFQQIF